MDSSLYNSYKNEFYGKLYNAGWYVDRAYVGTMSSDVYKLPPKAFAFASSLWGIIFSTNYIPFFERYKITPDIELYYSVKAIYFGEHQFSFDSYRYRINDLTLISAGCYFDIYLDADGGFYSLDKYDIPLLSLYSERFIEGLYSVIYFPDQNIQWSQPLESYLASKSDK